MLRNVLAEGPDSSGWWCEPECRGREEPQRLLRRGIINRCINIYFLIIPAAQLCALCVCVFVRKGKEIVLALVCLDAGVQLLKRTRARCDDSHGQVFCRVVSSGYCCLSLALSLSSRARTLFPMMNDPVCVALVSCRGDVVSSAS